MTYAFIHVPEAEILHFVQDDARVRNCRDEACSPFNATSPESVPLQSASRKPPFVFVHVIPDRRAVFEYKHGPTNVGMAMLRGR